MSFRWRLTGRRDPPAEEDRPCSACGTPFDTCLARVRAAALAVVPPPRDEVAVAVVVVAYHARSRAMTEAECCATCSHWDRAPVSDGERKKSER